MENDVNAEFPYTGDKEYDEVVKAFYVIRGVSFSILFILNLFQTYFEFRSLYRKGRKPTPRFFTFVSITLFPLCRGIQSFLALGFHNSRTGSPSWYLGIWGTLFLSTEWIFIGCFWVRLLYTFFSSKKIALGNIKKTWYSAWGIVVILFAWNTILMILISQYDSQYVASISGKGFICMVALLGTFLIINGFFLIKNLRKQDKKSKTFQKTIARTIRLSLILIFIVLGLIVREIVVAISKISTHSNYRYAAIFVTFILEFPQCIVVMVALADDGTHWKNYFLFQKVAKDSNSSAGSLNDSNSNIKNSGANLEIDLSSFNVDNESSSVSKSKYSQQQLKSEYSSRQNSQNPVILSQPNVSISISTNSEQPLQQSQQPLDDSQTIDINNNND
ncbi:hypothetical protein ACTFIT_003656 [Dictyostelium discoideum]